MNGYDSDMAPELLLRSGKRTTEPALSRSWREVVTGKYEAEVREWDLRDCRSEAAPGGSLARVGLTERTMGTRGCRMASAKMSGGA